MPADGRAMARRPLSTRKAIAYRAAAVLGSLIIVFALLEVVIRITMPYCDLLAMTGLSGPKGVDDPRIAWARVDAFSAFTPRPGTYPNTHKTVNSHGFISTPELDVTKPAGTIRITTSAAWTISRDGARSPTDRGASIRPSLPYRI